MTDSTEIQQFSQEEVGLAFRNHGMHLEGLRYPITPIGMHYLLIHFDIPVIDDSSFELEIAGRVRNPMKLSLEDLRSRPRVSTTVVMECAGNGRARLSPRPASAPWGEDAVGCSEWTGTPLAPIMEEVGLLDDAVEILFSGADRGIDEGVEHAFERSLPVGEALGEDLLLAYEINGHRTRGLRALRQSDRRNRKDTTTPGRRTLERRWLLRKRRPTCTSVCGVSAFANSWTTT